MEMHGSMGVSQYRSAANFLFARHSSVWGEICPA